MKILIIEDEAAIREEVMDWLMFEGHEVIGAANGKEGIEQALACLPDIIVSDITMPEVDGYGVLIELQHQAETSTIPFIFLTARADKSFVRHGMELGADDYVTKPFTRAELLSAINARLSRHQSITKGVRQEVDDLKTKIARMVSHELNTPVASLVFVQQVIERQLGQLDEHELSDLLQTMRVGTDRLQHLVQQVVYYTQIESGTLSAESIQANGSSIYLWQLMPAAIDLARRYAYRNRYATIVQDQRDADVPVWGSILLLKHALAELLTNALNFSQDDQPISVSQWHSEGLVWISILDQGKGISDIAQAEQHFEQIGRDIHEQQGLGIGLSVARKIIELHGGVFQLGSVVDRGTQITLGLPVYQAE